MKFLLVLGALCVFVSCSTIKTWIAPGGSWSSGGGEKFTGTMKMGLVSADKPGGWLSVEKEIADMAPLVFLEKGYLFQWQDEGADFIVDIQAREREYLRGWRTRRSLSVEVRIWDGPHPDEASSGAAPLAAGQAIASGNASLASSKTISRLLNLAADRAVEALVKSVEKM